MNVIIRLKSPQPKPQYDLYESNPTGMKLIMKSRTETKNPRTTRETTHFFILIRPIHVKKESSENAKAKST
jgi:hypothetical protein